MTIVTSTVEGFVCSDRLEDRCATVMAQQPNGMGTSQLAVKKK
jgi:hypothetical protein